MKAFETIKEILDFAIENEQEAVDFYNSLASQSKTTDMQAIFLQFAREEMGHKAKLLKIIEEGISSLSTTKVSDMKISDYLVEVKPSPNMTYQDALVLAMKKEKAAFKLYLTLAERASIEGFKQLFNELADEEAKHKVRFEIEYDEFVYREN